VQTSPGLGEHNQTIYGELGITTDELQDLAAAGVV
jgi:formyl-CoA transferase